MSVAESSIADEEDAGMGQQKALLAQLRAQLTARRTQAQQLLEEAHVSERVQKRREELLREEVPHVDLT
jgi:hypothetical protein